MNNIPQTVGELIEALSKIPSDTPVFHRGNVGNFVQGVWLTEKKLAKHKNKKENYVGDLSDPVWSKAKSVFHSEFNAVVLGG
jgi:hypothetical protein